MSLLIKEGNRKAAAGAIWHLKLGPDPFLEALAVKNVLADSFFDDRLWRKVLKANAAAPLVMLHVQLPVLLIGQHLFKSV